MITLEDKKPVKKSDQVFLVRISSITPFGLMDMGAREIFTAIQLHAVGIDPLELIAHGRAEEIS